MNRSEMGKDSESQLDTDPLLIKDLTATVSRTDFASDRTVAAFADLLFLDPDEVAQGHSV